MNGSTPKPILVDMMDGELVSKLVTAIADDNDRALKRKADKKKRKNKRRKKKAKGSDQA